MRVLLLNPPPFEGVNVVREGRCMQRTSAWTTVWAPVSLATSAAALREHGFEVKLADCSVEDIDWPGLGALIAAYQPGLVIINTATPSIESDLAVAVLAKKAWPGTRTLAMGIHPSALKDSCFDLQADLDMVARGEPEFTIRDAALALREGAPLDDVAGLSFRRRDGTVVHNEKRPFIENLDALPFPAWDLVNTGLYRMPFSGRRFVLIATARGCPYACTFCANKAYYGSRLRRRSPRRVVDEVEWVGENHGIRDFLFWSESFTNDQDYAIEVAEEISRRGLDVNWVCNSRVDTVSPRLLKAIKKAGCWMIGYGIESGNQDVLNSVRKGTTLADAVSAVRMAHEVGLEVTGHCILGFPGESTRTMQETIDFAKFLRLDYAQFYCAVAFPGSVMYRQALESGWLDNLEWKYFEQNFSVISTNGLSSDEIMAARDRAYKEFYRQPYLFWNVIKKVRSGRDITNFARMFKDFLAWV